MQKSTKKTGWFDVTPNELKTLFEIRTTPEGNAKLILFIIAMFLGPVTIAGALIFYVRGFMRFMYPNDELPNFTPMRPIIRVAMIIGACLAWVVVIVSVWLLVNFAPDIFGTDAAVVLSYIGGNLIASSIIYAIFRVWSTGMHNMLIYSNKFASSAYASKEALQHYFSAEGLFVGGDYAFNDKGHLLLCASTRSGKGTSLIVPNLMLLKSYTGNLVCIDIKGETCAITADYLRSIGKNVVVLNPFEILPDHIRGNRSYNPLALLSDKNSPHLVDDVMLLAENLLPIKPQDHNEYFTNAGRQIISAMLLHLVTSDKFKNQTMMDLWRMLRLPANEWANLLADMATCTNPVNGEAVRGAANEIAKQMESPETWASCLSNALQATDIFKSTLLNNAMKDGFDPYSLTEDNNTVVFIILPVDKISSHSRVLRLFTTTLMRAIVREPNPDVRTTFIADESYVLGFISEFETCLATYAGMGISLWLIYQDLSQIAATYGEHKFESIVSNCHVRLFSGIKDNFSAKYISEAMGRTTKTYYEKGRFGFIGDAEHIERDLATPDEVKGMSRDNFILFVGENTFTKIPKVPYFQMPELIGRYNANPYIKGS